MRLLTKLSRITNLNTYIVILLVIILFSVLTVQKINQIDLFYSYDPFYHYHITKYWELKNPLSNNAIGYNGIPLEFDYPTLFRLNTAIVNLVTEIDLILIYKYSGVFLRLISGLVMYLLIHRITKRRVISLFFLIVYLFTPYLFLRSLISYPENMAIVFHILVYYYAVKSIQKKEISIILFIFLAISLLVHYRSFIIPFSGVVITLIILFIDYQRKKQTSVYFKKLSLALLTFLLLSAPVLLPAINQYSKYSIENVGENASLKYRYEDTIQYQPPDYTFYVDQIGIFTISIFFYSIFLIFTVKGDSRVLKVTILFVSLSIICLILTRGKQFNLYIPPLRMFSFLSIALIPLLSISFLALKSFVNKQLYISILLSGVLVYVLNSLTIHGWIGLTKQDIILGYKLNTLLKSNTVLLWNKINPINLGVSRYDFIESNWSTNQLLVTKAVSGDISFYKEINRRYPGKKIYIITTDHIKKMKLINKTEQLNLYYYQ